MSTRYAAIEDPALQEKLMAGIPDDLEQAKVAVLVMMNVVSAQLINAHVGGRPMTAQEVYDLICEAGGTGPANLWKELHELTVEQSRRLSAELLTNPRPQA